MAEARLHRLNRPFLAQTPNLNFAMLTPSTGGEDMRKARALGRYVSRACASVDQTAAAEEEDALGSITESVSLFTEQTDHQYGPSP